jgi:hypothetical protein
MDVIFLERKGHEIVREVVVSNTHVIDHVVQRQYDVSGNITERKYQWEVENPNFKSLTKYKYSPTGDLIEIFHQTQSFNRPLHNQIDRYTYDKDGFLQKHLRTTRSGQDDEELILVEYYKTTSETATAVPGGTQ